MLVTNNSNRSPLYSHQHNDVINIDIQYHILNERVYFRSKSCFTENRVSDNLGNGFKGHFDFTTDYFIDSYH